MENIVEVTFSKLPNSWRALVVIGTITVFILLIILVIIVSLMFESKVKKEDNFLGDYDDFLKEFAHGKENINDDYPVLPKITDFDGIVLKNLMNIEIL